MLESELKDRLHEIEEGIFFIKILMVGLCIILILFNIYSPSCPDTSQDTLKRNQEILELKLEIMQESLKRGS